MKILNKLKRLYYKLLYSLPFAFKGGEVITNSTQDAPSEGTMVEKKVETQNLGEALLKGEVTQEVEDLRYSTYKVCEESRKYRYDGNGGVVKVIPAFSPTLKINQHNLMLTKSVLDMMKDMDDGRETPNKFTLNIEYENTPKFSLEKYCKCFCLSKKGANFVLDMEFDTFYSPNDVTERYFVQELKKPTRYNSLAVPLPHVSFITMNAVGQEDMFKYDLYDLSFMGIYFQDAWAHIEFVVNDMTEEDLKAKYYSKHQQDKYDKKEAKNQNVALAEVERKCFCSVCGREINAYDADITSATYGKPMCSDCLAKFMGIKN